MAGGTDENDKLTPLKRFEQNIAGLFKVGRTERRTKKAEREIQRLTMELRGLHSELEAIQGDLPKLRTQIEHQGTVTREVISARAAEIHRMTADLSRRMDLLAGLPCAGTKTTQPTSEAHPAGLESFLDNFYHVLENRFRGSTQEIRRRLSVYRPDIEAAALRCRGKPVLDLGCGRGEWLSLLSTWGLEAYGVDLNALQIEQAKTDGLDARLGDFQSTLRDVPDESLAAITAHHLIEHLPFPMVAWLAREAMRTLAPGGLLLLETPDVRNVLVGSTSFHNDPTHVQPRTEAVMGTLLDVVGFNPVEARRLHPHERLDEFIEKDTVDPEIAYLLFGAQDLTMVAYKPMHAS
ncbi:class I SAM-dependent methyltransferase [Palleronia sp.]|uniref:class I SAM-dependent methyltransferase n=1 Tax=Palleronia sp. TaxID=1940284 RepID=UPI0035C79271